MASVKANGLYPRPLRTKERELLEFVLPADRPGYREYLELIRGMLVLGEGRRGKGNIVLGFDGDSADTTSPLSPVIAFGMVGTTNGEFSITVRQYVGKQIDVEIVSERGEELPERFEEKKRWTFSSWSPGQFSPQSGTTVREVPVTSSVTLALSSADRRLWAHDQVTGMNHLLPVTTFHGELMVQKKLRDAKTVLKPNRFFDELDEYADSDLRAAFLSYNELRPRVTVDKSEVGDKTSTLRMGLMRLFRQGRHNG